MLKAEPTITCLLEDGQGVLNLTVELCWLKRTEKSTSCLLLG